MSDDRALYGLLAEFESSSELVAAVRALRAAGYRTIDCHAPSIVPGLIEALPAERTRLPLVMLLGAILCGGGFYATEYLLAVASYPHDIGGRPAFAWPAFIFPALELTLLGAALFGLFGMLLLDRLPCLHHPLFDVERFARASRDSYFVCVRAADLSFDVAGTRALVRSLAPKSVHEVRR